MKFLADFTSWLLRWIDDAATAALSIGGVLRRPRKFQLEEQADDNLFAVRRNHRSKALAPTATLSFEDGQFAESRGARVRSQLEGAEIELILAGRRFMFRSLELPKQASGFLDAIVRAQVDRLTPWTPAQVAFGCGAPTEMVGGRVGVTVAATARSSVIPLVNALELLAPDSIVVSTAPEAGTEKTSGPHSRFFPTDEPRTATAANAANSRGSACFSGARGARRDGRVVLRRGRSRSRPAPGLAADCRTQGRSSEREG